MQNVLRTKFSNLALLRIFDTPSPPLKKKPNKPQNKTETELVYKYMHWGEYKIFVHLKFSFQSMFCDQLLAILWLKKSNCTVYISIMITKSINFVSYRKTLLTSFHKSLYTAKIFYDFHQQSKYFPIFLIHCKTLSIVCPKIFLFLTIFDQNTHTCESKISED